MLEAGILAAFFALLFVYVFQPNWDIDIFWHIETGEWIVKNDTIPHNDIFSATDKTREWTPFQWLYEVLVYETNARLGFEAVRLMHALLYMGAFAGFYLVYRRRLGSRTTALAMLMLTLVMAEDRFRVRPEAFNFFFSALVLPILLESAVSARRFPGRLKLVFIALLAVVWASLHSGGALTLLVGTGAMFAGSLASFLLDRNGLNRDRFIHTTWIFGAAAIPMLLTPGFVKGVITAFTLVGHSRLLIPEWHPPAAYFLPSMGGRMTVHTFLCGTLPYVTFGWAALSTGLSFTRMIAARLSRGQNDGAATDVSFEPGLRLTALFFATLSITSSRFVYMVPFTVLALLYAGRNVCLPRFSGMSGKTLLLIIAVFLGLTSYQYSIAGYKKGLQSAVSLMKMDNEPGRYPERASDAIAAMGLKGRIFHYTQWGGYLLYRHFPDCDVFTDGRGNFTLDEREVMIDAHKPWSREESLEKAWHEYPFEIVIFPPPMFPLLDWDRTKWMQIYSDDVADVFLRVGPDNRENIERALRWWAAMGIQAPEGVDFQDHYRMVRGLREIERPEIEQRLSSAGRRAMTDDLPNRTSGLFDGALILFSAGLYEKSERFFKMVLDQDIRHSTAALYVAWCQHLKGRDDEARETLRANFGPAEIAAMPDRGPLKWAGIKILDVLGNKLGLETIPGHAP